MEALNALMRALFDALLYPFQDLNPLVGLTLVSFLATVLILPVIKWTTNQDQMDAVKKRIYASLFEIRLFNDNLRAILRASFDILRHNASYMWVWRGTFFVLIVVLLPMVAQLQFHYGYRGLEPGEKTLLKVELADTWKDTAKPAVELDLPAGLVAETPAVWVAPQSGVGDLPARPAELLWRLRAEQEGDYEVGIHLGGETYTKNIQVAHNVARRSTHRPARNFGDQLLYPAEAALPADAPIRMISVQYPAGDSGIGWEFEIGWMFIFFVLTIVFALALKKPMGVEF